MKRFSMECRKTKTKVTTLANHKGHRQFNEPIKTRAKCMQLMHGAGKSVKVRQFFYVLMLIG